MLGLSPVPSSHTDSGGIEPLVYSHMWSTGGLAIPQSAACTFLGAVQCRGRVCGLGGVHCWRLGRMLPVGSVVVREVRLLLFVGYVCYFLFLLFGGLLVCLWWVQGGAGVGEERGGGLLL